MLLYIILLLLFQSIVNPVLSYILISDIKKNYIQEGI
ncbi:hypothetical protein Bccel_0231 [Pseudobacteroides cellulosolvens ATCC 35603 = DSM 2933]|uniref:Uncharacterized protein n=1 Tax=Pseudobacteroides cellulosolvens ATCC 35603 = DSM 2933 TaxID=398512 RepID=A0A0L6JGX6_9FIRM|nr:hypothetical protein Bccel_0231 [Pseudobacteroides cellulosolvens ATCC 35603 = DSM 2933]